MGLSSNALKTVLDIDVMGSYNTLKATLPALLDSAARNHDSSGGLHPNPRGTGGRIIFVSATIQYTAIPLQTHLSVAKSGVDALSNSAAVELGPRGLTSNVIAPGPIQGTEGMERLARKEDLERGMKSVPIGRCKSSVSSRHSQPFPDTSVFPPGGRVKEIADATVFIFGDTGNFVNGQTLVGKHLPIGPAHLQ